jgi:uncharacterized protein
MAMICPNCHTIMAQVHEPDVSYERCPSCEGRWLDKGELNLLATGLAGDIELCTVAFDETDPARDEAGQRRCPSCAGSALSKVDLLDGSDIIFDHCPTCGGFFLDKGELEAMNQELRRFSEIGRAQEIRAFRGPHLVRVDRLSAVKLTPAGAVTAIGFVTSVFFERPLGLGLRIERETWGFRLRRRLGLSRRPDILTGDDAFDRRFIVGGDDEERVRAALSPLARERILSFAEEGGAGQLSVLDDRAVFVDTQLVEPKSVTGRALLERRFELAVAPLLGIVVAIEAAARARDA